ncbi:MAG TPA: shikimate kinase, partial [Clostridiales bacterium]|nr:shikimate kinase [Clostridiales bacterium]
KDADIIINTTPVGMFPDVTVSPVELSLFPSLSGVVDLIYNPLRTDFMLQAEERGIPAAGGMGMLVAQAIATHELFFHVKIKEKTFRDILSTLTHRVQNIVLCGMPGTGKSSVARRIGELTGRAVIDTDTLAEQLAGKSIPEIFAEDGETFFRVYEHQAIEEACKHTGIVISLGGGAVTNEANYKPIKRNGRIYCLHRDLSLLPLDNRPLSRDRAALSVMEKERAPLYAKFSDITMENDGTLEEIVQAVLDNFASQ